MLKRIISGGQTGADMAGVTAGRFLGLSTGGCVPLGRRTDEGEMPEEIFRAFGFVEHTEAGYAPRTRINVEASDGTVIFGRLSSPGCRLTIEACSQRGKPMIFNPSAEELRAWIDEHQIEVLNVAGNRERTNPGIFKRTFDFLIEALKPGLF